MKNLVKIILLIPLMHVCIVWGVCGQHMEKSSRYPELKKRLEKVAKAEDVFSVEIEKNIGRIQTDTSYRNKVFKYTTELANQRTAIENKFIADFPAELLSYHLIRKQLGGTTDIGKITEMLGKLDPKLMDAPGVKGYLDTVEKMKKLQVGNPAPDFTSKDSNGQRISLSDFKGKYVLLDFWASWCGPCRAENPHVVKAYTTFKQHNFTVLGVSLDREDGKEAWKKAIQDDSLTWTQVSDLAYWKSPVAQLYFVNAIPQNFLIDPKGIIIAKNLRGDELNKKLAEILPGRRAGESQGDVDNEAVSEAILSFVDVINKDTAMNSAQVLEGFNRILQRYPEKKYRQVNYLYDFARLFVIPKLLQLDYPYALDSLQQVKSDLLKRPLYESVVHVLRNKGQRKKAEELITAEIKRVDVLRHSNTTAMGSYYDYLLTYVRFLNDTERFREALKYVEQMRSEGKFADENLGLYGMLLYRNKDYRGAILIFEGLSRRGRTNDQEKMALKDAWSKVNKSKISFETYFGELNRQMKDYVVKIVQEKKVSYVAPDFELRDLDGTVVSLRSLKGKVVFLDFWATWCGPCVGSFPAMKRASELYKNRNDVVFLFINTNEKALDYAVRRQEVSDFLRKGKYDLRVLLDENTEKEFHMKEAYKVTGIPAKFIINKEGWVQYAFSGFSRGTDDSAVEEIRQMVDSLLQ